MLNKRINLLIQLALVDGKFDDSERALLRSILREKKRGESYSETHPEEVLDIRGVESLKEKAELLHWVLKLTHAGNVLHSSEIEFSRFIAEHLGYDQQVVDYFVLNDIGSYNTFLEIARGFEIKKP